MVEELDELVSHLGKLFERLKGRLAATHGPLSTLGSLETTQWLMAPQFMELAAAGGPDFDLPRPNSQTPMLRHVLAPQIPCTT